MPFLECEVFFFSAVSWHSATLVLFLLFCLLCSICFAMYKKKSDKDFMGGHQIMANLFVFFFDECAWKDTMRARTYNMEIKVT